MMESIPMRPCECFAHRKPLHAQRSEWLWRSSSNKSGQRHERSENGSESESELSGKRYEQQLRQRERSESELSKKPCRQQLRQCERSESERVLRGDCGMRLSSVIERSELPVKLRRQSKSELRLWCEAVEYHRAQEAERVAREAREAERAACEAARQRCCARPHSAHTYDIDTPLDICKGNELRLCALRMRSVTATTHGHICIGDVFLNTVCSVR